jgi:hypothetical protein
LGHTPTVYMSNELVLKQQNGVPFIQGVAMYWFVYAGYCNDNDNMLFPCKQKLVIRMSLKRHKMVGLSHEDVVSWSYGHF